MIIKSQRGPETDLPLLLLNFLCTLTVLEVLIFFNRKTLRKQKLCIKKTDKKKEKGSYL